MPAQAFTVTLEPGGEQFTAATSEPLLLAAERAGIALPSSCRNGTCRTCICLMTQGSVRYQIEWPGLSAGEKTEGWILPCVALAASDLALSVGV